jgi:K+-transporting ATPase KdpF subunit
LAGSTLTSAKKCEGIMENIVVGIIAMLLFVYLLVAMIRPEKF